MLIADLQWREPLWLWVSLQPLALWAAYRWLHRGRATAYAQPALLPWLRYGTFRAGGWQRSLQALLIGLAWILLAIALAGPRVPLQRFATDAVDVKEVVAVVDLSRSMAASDITPSRIERAKLELHDLLQHLNDERLGLVVFASRPHVLAPPSADRAVLRHYIDTLSTRLLPTEGSDLSAALRYAADVFTPGSETRRAILLLSNGPDQLQDAARQAELLEQAHALRKRGIAVYVLGLGTAEGEAVLDDQGRWLQHQGRPLRSHLEMTLLRALAEQGGGHYTTVRDTHEDWDALYHRGVALLGSARGEERGQQHIIYRELYATALILGAISLVVAVALVPALARLPRGSASAMVFMAVSLTSPPPNAAEDTATPDAAYAAYRAKQYDEAERLYSRQRGYSARFGQGASAYLNGDFNEAIKQFTAAVLSSDNDDQRADAIFNLGNAYYQSGDYENAAVLFADVLRYRPDDAYAAMNYRFVAALYREVRRAILENRLGQGRGPRTEMLPEGTDVGESSLSLAEDDATLQPPSTPPPGVDPGRWQAFIERGLEHARMASQRVESQTDEGWSYDISAAHDIHLETMFAVDEESGLWRRIFELEEGFPAPLPHPRDVPGQVPW